MLVETIRGATLYVERWPCFIAFSNSSLKLSFLFHKRSRQISRLDRSYRALEERKKLHKIIKEKWNRVKKYRDRIRIRDAGTYARQSSVKMNEYTFER